MACEECSRNCQLVHGKKKDLSSSVSRFVKIFIGDDISDILCLPPKSAKPIWNLVGKDVKLVDSIGAQWTVTLSNHKGFLAFDKGWTKFAADHKLQIGQILVFNYLKNGKFDVLIFEHTCDEKREFSYNFRPDKHTITTERIASEATPSQRNAATNGLNFRKVGRPFKQARSGGNLVKSRTSLETSDGDNRTSDTSETNGESSSTSVPIESNFETTLNQPSMSDGPSKPKSGHEEQPCLDDASIESNFEIPLNLPSTSNGPSRPEPGLQEQPCLDDASCVIMDRSTYYAETEKKVVLYDLSVFEVQKSQHISGKRCIDGAQKFEASMAEANNTGTGFVGSITVSKVPNTVMVKDTKAFRHMDNNTGNCSKPPMGKGNFSKSALDNGFGSPLPRQVHPMDEIKAVKKEQVTLREEASDRVQKPQDLKQSVIRDGEGPSTSSYKRKATKLEPDDSLEEPALFPDSITCLAVTDDRDFIELPDRLPSIACKKSKGRVDNRYSIVLIDPKKRKWPAIYRDKFGSSFSVICGWKRFNEANKIRPGDHYVFGLENGSQCTYKVDVVRI